MSVYATDNQTYFLSLKYTIYAASFKSRNRSFKRPIHNETQTKFHPLGKVFYEFIL